MNRTTQLDELHTDYFACDSSSARKVTAHAHNENVQRVTIDSAKMQLDLNGLNTRSFYLMKNNILIGLFSNENDIHQGYLIMNNKNGILLSVPLGVSQLHMVVNTDDSMCIVFGKKSNRKSYDDFVLLVFRIDVQNLNQPTLSLIIEHALKNKCSYHLPWNAVVTATTFVGSVLIIATTMHVQKYQIEDQIVLTNDINRGTWLLFPSSLTP